MSNDRIRDVAEASKALESTLVKQLLESSGAFKGTTGVAGSQIHAQMFMEVLADAVTKSGGFGLASMLEKSLGPVGGKTEADGDGATLPGIDSSGKATGGLSFAGRASSLRAWAPLPDRPAADTATELLREGALPLAKQGPVTHPYVSSGFGPRIHPIDGTKSFHTGMDLAASQGAPILAVQGGTVRSAGPRGAYGNAVEIDHGGGVTSLYAHASTLSVKAGDVVQPGEQVGEVGATGRATGPHLHFEVRVEGKAIDPKKALNAYGMRAESTVEESHKQASTMP